MIKPDRVLDTEINMWDLVPSPLYNYLPLGKGGNINMTFISKLRTTGAPQYVY